MGMYIDPVQACLPMVNDKIDEDCNYTHELVHTFVENKSAALNYIKTDLTLSCMASKYKIILLVSSELRESTIGHASPQPFHRPKFETMQPPAAEQQLK